MELLAKSPSQCSFVFLDLETSGKYPLEAEICEVAAVKWESGQFTDTFQSLIKTKEKMSDEVIKIHNITNEMLTDSPEISTQIQTIRNFIGDSITVAHHAPFDLGFLAYEFEKHGVDLPTSPALCTSLITRAKILNIQNHRLQTLVKYFHIDSGQAHRALDDAKSCAQVFFNTLKLFELPVTIRDLVQLQNKDLSWHNYSIHFLKQTPHLQVLLDAVVNKKKVNLKYSGGSKPNEFRELFPHSVVRNPDGDFLVADDFKSNKLKRYLISKITDCLNIET